MEPWSNKLKIMNFVEHGLKNLILMSWAMTSMELRDNQAQIKDISANGCLVRRDPNLMYSDHNIKMV